MSRKYSDPKYDNPEQNARIEQQTLRALESLGVHGLVADSQKRQFLIEANHLKSQTKSGKPAKAVSPHGPQGAASGQSLESEAKKTKNVFGLDFDMPEELSELLSQEMGKKGTAGRKESD